MIAGFPECTFSVFPLVVLLSSAARRQLNALRDNLSVIPVMNEVMNAVERCHVLEDDHPIAPLSLKELVEPALPILGKFEEKFLLVTTMCDVPNITRYVVAIGSWHAVETRRPLSLAFSMGK